MSPMRKANAHLRVKPHCRIYVMIAKGVNCCVSALGPGDIAQIPGGAAGINPGISVE